MQITSIFRKSRFKFSFEQSQSRQQNFKHRDFAIPLLFRFVIHVKVFEIHNRQYDLKIRCLSIHVLKTINVTSEINATIEINVTNKINAMKIAKIVKIHINRLKKQYVCVEIFLLYVNE